MKFLLPWLLISYTVQDTSIVFGDPVQTAAWDVIPDIIICDGAPVSLQRVENAAEYWRHLGHNIGEVTVASHNNYGCINQIALVGTIQINLASQSFDMARQIGLTKTWSIKDTKEIFKSRIEVMSGWGDTERIMEHELGHALGFRDYNQTGHIMHSDWSRGGLNAKGLKNNR